VNVRIIRGAIQKPPCVVVRIEPQIGSDLAEIGLALSSSPPFGGGAGGEPNQGYQEGKDRHDHGQFDFSETDRLSSSCLHKFPLSLTAHFSLFRDTARPVLFRIFWKRPEELFTAGQRGKADSRDGRELVAPSQRAGAVARLRTQAWDDFALFRPWVILHGSHILPWLDQEL
jgi:hypothetical protein